jgi:hypothetical protein
VFACVPAVFYITPDAADITAAEADEIGCFTLVKTFSLEGIKGFHDRQGLFCLRFNGRV